MIQRDLKIGLVLGLVLVIAVVIKFAVDPRLSTESRVMQLNNSAGGGRISDSNELLQNFILSEIPSASEPVGVPAGQPEQAASNEPGSGLVARDVSLETRDTSPESRVVQQEDSLIEKAAAVSSETLNPALIQPSGDIKNNLSAKPVSSSGEPEKFDYEKAEIVKTERFHFVLKNETLSDISRKYYGSAGQWKKIVAANPDVIKDPNKVKAGTKLIIP